MNIRLSHHRIQCLILTRIYQAHNNFVVSLLASQGENNTTSKGLKARPLPSALHIYDETQEYIVATAAVAIPNMVHGPLSATIGKM